MFEEQVDDQIVMEDDEVSPIELAAASASYVGKINQENISIPLTMAALGNEDYTDKYTIAKQLGFDVDSPTYPNVTREPEPPRNPVKFRFSLFDKGQMTGGASYIENKNKYYDAVTNAAVKHGLPPSFFHALINAESGYNPQAKSSAGAQGIAQIMPGTAKDWGLKNPYDPVESINVAAKNLGGFYRTYLKNSNSEKEALAKTAAAYNAGPNAVAAAKGVPNFKETKNYVKKILSDMGIDYVPGEYTMNYSFANNRLNLVNKDTGTINAKGVNDMLFNVRHYKDDVLYIETNRPELLENKPQFAQFAKFRNIKATDGKPLFRKGDSNYQGFRVHYKNKAISNGTINPNARPALADDAYRTQTDAIPKVERDEIAAAFAALDQRSISYKGDNTKFGLANLTKKEYMDYGVPEDVLQNPVMQSRVLAQEFQRAMDVFDSERQAIYALAGGKMVDSDTGESKSWEQIKKERDEFTKQWFIDPPVDKGQRTALNKIVAKYNAEYKRLRGD